MVEICGIFLAVPNKHRYTRMKKEKHNPTRCSERELLRELASEIKALGMDIRTMKWQQSMTGFDFVIPMLFIALLGERFLSNTSPHWSKEAVEELLKQQKEKFSPASTPGAQQPE